ncbi:MAG: hypothetical protein K1Y36_20950 [Blastocatellia bacterium]|nr:hypothetical protein [Blastocatellia bacterium]
MIHLTGFLLFWGFSTVTNPAQTLPIPRELPPPETTITEPGPLPAGFWPSPPEEIFASSTFGQPGAAGDPVSKELPKSVAATSVPPLELPQFSFSDRVPLQPGPLANRVVLPNRNPETLLASGERGFQWAPAFKQSFHFLIIQHLFRFGTESGTRSEFNGPFFKDYFKSVGSLRGWDDGDPFLVNYIGHPMQGAVTGYIQIHNDPKGICQEVGFNRGYWNSRLKAMGWSALYSTQFEIGPISEASLGNVGKFGTKKSPHPMAFVDLVVTPTLGTGVIVGEDLLDKYVIQKIERQTANRTVRLLTRSFLNPSRSFANLLRSKWPWYRDGRPL